jgi:hypothetical protein
MLRTRARCEPSVEALAIWTRSLGVAGPRRSPCAMGARTVRTGAPITTTTAGAVRMCASSRNGSGPRLGQALRNLRRRTSILEKRGHRIREGRFRDRATAEEGGKHFAAVWLDLPVAQPVLVAQVIDAHPALGARAKRHRRERSREGNVIGPSRAEVAKAAKGLVMPPLRAVTS